MSRTKKLWLVAGGVIGVIVLIGIINAIGGGGSAPVETAQPAATRVAAARAQIVAQSPRAAASPTVKAASVSSVHYEDQHLVIEDAPTLRTGQYGTKCIAGTADVKRSLSYAQVQFPLYDANGSIVGHALDNINSIKLGQSWAFCAAIIDTTGTAAKFGKVPEVTAFR